MVFSNELGVFVFLNTGCEKSSNVGSRSPAATKAGGPAVHFQDKYYDVSMGDKGNVWIVGYYGAILRSSDGGKNWTRQDSGTSSSLLGVDFVNDREGWAVGESD
jgi:photosystem II stability/assembly factor-like uncharacterized protein